MTESPHRRAPTVERYRVLEDWLTENWTQFTTDLALTTAAIADVQASGSECDWLAEHWRDWRAWRMGAEESQIVPSDVMDDTVKDDPAPEDNPADPDLGPVPAVSSRPRDGGYAGSSGAPVNNPPALREPSRLDDLARLGTWLALSESGSDSEKARGASAALRLYYVQELDLPPLAASEISVIKGRLNPSATLLRALARQRGYLVVRVGVDNDYCEAALVNATTGEEIGRTIFTMTEAKRAGLVKSGGNWEKYPQRMLWARASKFVVQDYAPEVALGLIAEDDILVGEIVSDDNGAAIPDDPGAVPKAPGESEAPQE